MIYKTILLFIFIDTNMVTFVNLRGIKNKKNVLG